ncbi:MAG: hypothetical protein ACRC3A_07230, partial [Culicoidibacterales bacterium]
MDKKELLRKFSTPRGLISATLVLVILILLPVAWENYATFFSIGLAVLTPFIGGFIIAYLFLPVVELVSTKWLKGRMRALTSLLVLVIAATILIYLLLFIFPLVATQL